MILRIPILTVSHARYWGWCKYRYREMRKNNFDQVKKAAFQCLEARPTEVIRRFVKRSWRFMDEYRKCLTGDAAVWLVKAQKGPPHVSEQAMRALEAVSKS